MKRYSLLLHLCCLIAASSVATGASAQPVAAPSAPAAAAPDLVRLKNGGMIRGTISELVPKEYVVIALSSGETRRFEMSEVQYAGPAAEAPQAEASQGAGAQAQPGGVRPLVTVHAGEASVKLEGDEPELTFHRVTGSATAVAYGRGGTAVGFATAFDELCTAPCDISIATGSYQFGLSKGSGGVVQVRDRVTIQGPSLLHGSYTSYRGLRIAGLVGIIVSVGVGATLMFTSRTTEDCGIEGIKCAGLDTGQLFAGLGVMVGGGLVGTILMLKSDSAEIRVEPLSTGARGPRTDNLSADDRVRAATARPASGLSLTGRF